MNARNSWTGIFPAAGMLFLIIDSHTAAAGMQSGIELCLKTIIPSLFPFFILSFLLTGNLTGCNLKILRPFSRFCGIPEGAESLLITGFLGGYPVGAQNTALACQRGSISAEDAQRMLAFCSNAGPAFLFGIVGPLFDSPRYAWALWGIHITSALIVGAITGKSSTKAAAIAHQSAFTLTQALQKSLSVMAQVCGWVVLFRMILAYLDRWLFWLLPQGAQIFAAGLLELSNGCIRLQAIDRDGIRFTAASFLLAIGGLCVTLQTSSVTRGLSLQYYYPGKLLQGALSILLSICAQVFFPEAHRMENGALILALSCIASLIAIGFLRKNQKNSSIPLSVGV